MSSPVTREAIEAALQPVVGQPIDYWGRAADMADIGFGKPIVREGFRGPEDKSEFVLHIQCAWRILSGGLVVLGSWDYYRPPIGSGIDEDDFDTSKAKRTRQDDLVDLFLAHSDGPHRVSAIAGESTGDVEITFNDGCQLQTFVTTAQRDDATGEQWRFFEYDAEDHFVVLGDGIEGPDA